MLQPKKDIIQRAIDDGSIDKLNSLMSVAYLLSCESSNLMMEASDLMKKKGLLIGRIKQMYTMFARASDCYMTEFSSMVHTNERKMRFFNDMDGLHKVITDYIKSSMYDPSSENKTSEEKSKEQQHSLT